MASNYIPRNDSKFNTWVINLLSYIASHSMNWGLPPDLLMKLNERLDRWKTAFAAAENPETRTKASVKTKTEVRKTFEAEVRVAVKAYITYNPAVTDGDRENMALPIHDTKPTPVPAPTERPDLAIDFSQQEEHSLKVTGNPRPYNAHGFEAWYKVGGTPPVTSKDFAYAGFSTKSPFTVKFEFEDKGKTVYYRVRWVNAKNEPGPWSELVSAVIA
jgi:hypothetical protein